MHRCTLVVILIAIFMFVRQAAAASMVKMSHLVTCYEAGGIAEYIIQSQVDHAHASDLLGGSRAEECCSYGAELA